MNSWFGWRRQNCPRHRIALESQLAVRYRRTLAPEILGPRLLLSFSQAGTIGGWQASWADFNNDGWADLYAEGTLYRNDNGTLNHFQSF